jgi:hypothetical protein
MEFMTASKSGMSGFHFGSGVCFTWCLRLVFRTLIAGSSDAGGGRKVSGFHVSGKELWYSARFER